MPFGASFFMYFFFIQKIKIVISIFHFLLQYSCNKWDVTVEIKTLSVIRTTTYSQCFRCSDIWFLEDIVYPLYIDTRYNTIHYNDNLTSMTETFALKVTVNQKLCKNIVFNTSRNVCFGYFVLMIVGWPRSSLLNFFHCTPHTIAFYLPELSVSRSFVSLPSTWVPPQPE